MWADLEHTVLTPMGVTNPWLAVVPVLVALAAAVAFAVRATPPAPVGEIGAALLAVVVWGATSTVTPSIAGDPQPPLGGGTATLGLVALAVCSSAFTLLLVRYVQRRGAASEPRPLSEPAPLVPGLGAGPGRRVS